MMKHTIQTGQTGTDVNSPYECSVHPDKGEEDSRSPAPVIGADWCDYPVPLKSSYSLKTRIIMLVFWLLTATITTLEIILPGISGALNVRSTIVLFAITIIPFAGCCSWLIVTAGQGKHKRVLLPLISVCIPDMECAHLYYASLDILVLLFFSVVILAVVLLPVAATVFSCFSVALQKRKLRVTAVVLTVFAKLNVIGMWVSFFRTAGGFTGMTFAGAFRLLTPCAAATVFQLICLFGTSEPKQTPPGDKPE